MIMNVFISFWSLCVGNYHSIMGCFVANIEMANNVCVIVETNFQGIHVYQFIISLLRVTVKQ